MIGASFTYIFEWWRWLEDQLFIFISTYIKRHTSISKDHVHHNGGELRF